MRMFASWGAREGSPSVLMANETSVRTKEGLLLYAPFLRRYHFHYTTVHPPALNAVHVRLEVTKFVHGGLEDRNSTRGQGIIVGGEPRSTAVRSRR